MDPLPRPKSASSDLAPFWQRKSSSTSSTHSISPTSPGLSPKVQLVPYARTASFKASFSDAENQVLKTTSFDAFDLSSKDFDFEDIFTYDKPQKKLTKVVEVSTASRERDWSSFSFSHYSAAMNARSKVNRPKTGIGELYLKNQGDARKQSTSSGGPQRPPIIP